ncbi:MAG: hypothetical protein ACQET3_12795 [Promethearchaeati archaeon]
MNKKEELKAVLGKVAELSGWSNRFEVHGSWIYVRYAEAYSDINQIHKFHGYDESIDFFTQELEDLKILIEVWNKSQPKANEEYILWEE